MSSVRLTNIAKRYDDRQAVIHGVDLDIADGELVVFVGPSGCGKSTLLRMIAGLEEISGGELHIGERLANHVPPAQRGLAMVFQSYALYPHMSVFENMAFALRLAGQKGAALNEAVERAAAILQITHLLQRKPKELSGGQRQRVAIGRAIVRKPEVFLFDEPLSNLDANLRVQMRVEISRLHQELGTTMIYVTHDQVEAMTLGQRIVILNAGRIEQVGTPWELYNHPANLFVAGFLGAPKMNFFKGEVASPHTVRLAGGTELALAAAAPAGALVTVGVRAEHLAVGSAGGIPAEVRHVEYLGDQSVVYCATPAGADLVAARHAAGSAPPMPGTRITLAADPEACHIFGQDGLALAREHTGLSV
jgi:multiple sugar transport system ATP-binding protein